MVGEDAVIRLWAATRPNGANRLIEGSVDAAVSFLYFRQAGVPETGMAGGRGCSGQRVMGKACFGVGRNLQSERQLHGSLIWRRLLWTWHGQVFVIWLLSSHDCRQGGAQRQSRSSSRQVWELTDR